MYQFDSAAAVTWGRKACLLVRCYRSSSYNIYTYMTRSLILPGNGNDSTYCSGKVEKKFPNVNPLVPGSWTTHEVNLYQCNILESRRIDSAAAIRWAEDVSFCLLPWIDPALHSCTSTLVVWACTSPRSYQQTKAVVYHGCRGGVGESLESQKFLYGGHTLPRHETEHPALRDHTELGYRLSRTNTGWRCPTKQDITCVHLKPTGFTQDDVANETRHQGGCVKSKVKNSTKWIIS